jgi:hypothetical protein
MTDPDSGAVPPVPPPAEPVAPQAAAPATPPPAPPVAPPPPAGYAAPAPAYATGVVAPKKTLSLIGMIAGIVGLVGFWIVFIPVVGSILGLFLPAAALVLGILGRKREGVPARGFWLTAIITGIVGLVIAVIALIGWIVVFAIGNSTGAFTNSY